MCFAMVIPHQVWVMWQTRIPDFYVLQLVLLFFFFLFSLFSFFFSFIFIFSLFFITWTSPFSWGKPLKFKVCHFLCARCMTGGRRGVFNFKDQSRERLAGIEKQKSRRKELILPKRERKHFQGSTLFQLFSICGKKNDMQRHISEN